MHNSTGNALGSGLVSPSGFGRLLSRVLVAKCSSSVAGGTGFELYETQDGRLALLAYRSLVELIQACGTGQSWMPVHLSSLPTLKAIVGFDVLAWNVRLPEGSRRPEVDAAGTSRLQPIVVDDAGGRVFVPSKPFRRGAGQVVFELQPGVDGRPALVVFSSRERLRAGCGPFQPWVAVPVEALPEVVERSGARAVLTDPVLAESARHPRPRAVEPQQRTRPASAPPARARRREYEEEESFDGFTWTTGGEF